MSRLAIIDTDTVASYLHPSEAPAITDEDRMQAVIVAVCNEVAGYVAAYSGNLPIRLNVCKVPAELEHVACVLVRQSVVASIPGSDANAALDNASRSAEYSRARETLLAVARGEIRLSDYSEDPDASGESGASSGGWDDNNWLCL